MNENTDMVCLEDGLQSRLIGQNERLKLDLGAQQHRALVGELCPDERKEYEDYHSYYWSFKKIEWKVFGTLTWANSSRRYYSYDTEILRRHDFNRLLRKACVKFEIRPKHLPFYRAMEWSPADECHYHFLIANHPSDPTSASKLAAFLQSFWTDQFQPFGISKKGAGRAWIVPYDKARGHAGVKYCLKREKEKGASQRERFDFLSPNLIQLINAQNN